MLARLFAFLIWALVAAASVFWGLRLLVRPPAAPTHAVAVDDSTTVRGDLTRLLGAVPLEAVPAAASPEANARFRLLGIMAPKPNSASRQGFAVIAVDGKPPRAFAVGARVDGDLVLQSVSWRAASIGPAQGVPTMTLELPLLLAAATGTLPGTGAGNGNDIMPGAATRSGVPQAVLEQPVTYPPEVPLSRPPRMLPQQQQQLLLLQQQQQQQQLLLLQQQQLQQPPLQE